MTITAKTYGGALYDLAKNEDLTQILHEQLQAAVSVFNEMPEYASLLTEPSVPKDERRQLIDDAWRDKIHPYLLNFLKLLCDNGTIDQFTDCAEAYRKRYYEDQGIMEVRAVCAAEMSTALQEKLQKKLEKLTGKTIELTTTVDEKLIGGIRLELPDRQFDGSVQYHLDEMSRILQSSAF